MKVNLTYSPQYVIIYMWLGKTLCRKCYFFITVGIVQCYALLQLDRFQHYNNPDRSQESCKDSGMY